MSCAFRKVTTSAEFRIVGDLEGNAYVLSLDLAGREHNDSYHANTDPRDLVRPGDDTWESLDLPSPLPPARVVASATGRRIVWDARGFAHDASAQDSDFPFLVDEIQICKYPLSANYLLLLSAGGPRWIPERASYVVATPEAAQRLAARIFADLTWDDQTAAAAIECEMNGVIAFEAALAGAVVEAYDSFKERVEATPLLNPEDVWYDFARRGPQQTIVDAERLITSVESLGHRLPGRRGVWLWLEGTYLPETWARVRLPPEPSWARQVAWGRSMLVLAEDLGEILAARWLGEGRWSVLSADRVQPMRRLPWLGAEGISFSKTFDGDGYLVGGSGDGGSAVGLVDVP